MLSQQSGLYVDTADQLVQLVRSTLVNAWYVRPDVTPNNARHQLLPLLSTPNFSLAPALDVLTTGSYPRLPTSIKERIIPLSPLKEEEQQQAFSLISCAIRRRLLKERVPERMKAVFIGEERREERREGRGEEVGGEEGMGSSLSCFFQVMV